MSVSRQAVPEPLRAAGEAVRPHVWKTVAVAAFGTVLVQRFGPLAETSAAPLLIGLGTFALVWDALLDRARKTLDFAQRHGWKLIGAIGLTFVAVQELGLFDSYWQTVAIQLFMFGVLALSWDLLGGQTGYPSFGNIAFFGVGAYTAAVLLKDYAVGLPVALLAAGVAALIFGAVIGGVVLRLRGGYFAIATLGVTLAAQQVATNLEVTGGSSGRILFDVSQQVTYYYGLLALLLVEVALLYYLSGTRFGYTLNAIRDDEDKAISMGVNTTYYKTAAWMVAALFTGLAGGLWAPYNKFVDPNAAMSAAWNVELIVMAFLGGTGTIAGPVIGAFSLRSITLQVEALFPGSQLIVLGLVVITAVIVFPEGIIGQLKERASEMEYYKRGGAAAGQEQTGGMDVVSDGGES